MKKVIIIGSGIGGLTAGNLLAQKGHQVSIFESHLTPGGYTAGFCRKGYYFESGTVSFEASSSVFKAMKDIGVLEKIDFERIRARLISEDFDEIPDNYQDYKKMIYTAFPAEKEQLDLAFSDLDRIMSFMASMDQPMPNLFSGWEMFKSMLPFILSFPEQNRIFKQFGNMTSSEFAARYFKKDSKLFQLFQGTSYPDMPAMFGNGLLSVLSDLWTVKGGMQSWADTLVQNFKGLGGDLRLKSYVDRIITENGAAVGVSCQDTVHYADYVIAACDYKKTLLKLIDDQSLISPALQDSIESAAVSEGCFTVYLGLNISNEELGQYMKVPHVFPFYYQPGYDIYNSDDQEFFSKTNVYLYSPSMINPQLAPAGKSSLMLQTIVPFRWMNNWGGGDRKAYKQLKEKAMETMIDNASRLVPILPECIEYKDAATPLTYERFTHNSDGATSAWSWNPNKRFFKNPVSVNIETPVRNLYIGSCWAFQIGGVPGAIAAAYECSKKIK
ncbi:carotenoid cis-trans isomerase [hydrocarbon metagenome]|uniref:Carotenoid cis-trans isomerase n=1 Tax=hydrocarbon metagenome TaxID=938273 RepID=A0A0W8E1X4_9ZZZZ